MKALFALCMIFIVLQVLDVSITGVSAKPTQESEPARGLRADNASVKPTAAVPSKKTVEPVVGDPQTGPKTKKRPVPANETDRTAEKKTGRSKSDAAKQQLKKEVEMMEASDEDVAEADEEPAQTTTKKKAPAAKAKAPAAKAKAPAAMAKAPAAKAVAQAAKAKAQAAKEKARAAKEKAKAQAEDSADEEKAPRRRVAAKAKAQEESSADDTEDEDNYEQPPTNVADARKRLGAQVGKTADRRAAGVLNAATTTIQSGDETMGQFSGLVNRQAQNVRKMAGESYATANGIGDRVTGGAMNVLRASSDVGRENADQMFGLLNTATGLAKKKARLAGAVASMPLGISGDAVDVARVATGVPKYASKRTAIKLTGLIRPWTDADEDDDEEDNAAAATAEEDEGDDETEPKKTPGKSKASAAGRRR